MPIYNIPNSLNIADYKSWDLNDKFLQSFQVIENYQHQLDNIKLKNNYLRDLPIKEILNFFDSLSIHWLTDENSKFLDYFSQLGVSFLINFFKRNNLEQFFKESLHGNIHCLDDFINTESLNKKIMAHPRGVITHWLAGNVPVLGMISLVQGLITKNVNVIKLPRENGLVLPLMLSHLSTFVYKSENLVIKGNDLLDSCMFIYCEKDDQKSQEILSLNSDIRVAWGGKEAVETVMTLPRRYGTEDVIFGPKYSFAVIGKNSFEKNQLKDIAYNLALDASVFEQQGCNSPHTVFVENGSEVSPLEFAKVLAKSMDEVLKRMPKSPVSADQAYTIVDIRTEYSFTGQVFSSKGTEWTVIYSDEKGLANACFSRTVFVRPVDNIDEVLNFIEHNNHQTMGLCIQDSLKIQFARKATRKGIERITELGKMSVFDYPWDGMFPTNRLVRWVSCQN